MPKYRALQVVYYDDRLVQPGDVIESDDEFLEELMAPGEPSRPMEIQPVFQRVPEGGRADR